MLNNLLVLEANNVEAGPIATIKLPIRLRNGVYGKGVPSICLLSDGPGVRHA